MSLPSCLFTGETPAPSSFYPPINKVIHMDKISLHFLLSRVTSAMSLSFSSHDRYFNPFIISVTLLWPCSSTPTSL